MRPTTPDPHWFRRLNHTAAAAIIFYFLIPFDIGPLPRWGLLLVVLIIPLSIEVLRLAKGTTFMGLREYEKGRLSSYMWFNIGAVGLLLASDWWGLPQAVAAGCIVLAAMVDPLLGELKRKDRTQAMLVGVVAATLILVIFEIPWFYALIAAAAAVWAEQFVIRQLDDDLLMQVVPAAVLALLGLAGSALSFMPELTGVTFEPFQGVGL